MNLWVRRIGQLVLVAQFLFACKEDTSLLGFKNPNSKFGVRYVEIPIESSTYLVDSLSTSTYQPNSVRQFLIGTYTDPELGVVTTIPHTQFLPFNRNAIDLLSVFDSAFIELRYTFSVVGQNKDITPQTVSVFELTEALGIDSLPYYFNTSIKSVNPTSLGTTTFLPDPNKFEEYVTAGKDTTILLRIPIQNFGEELFNTALAFSDGSDSDSTYYYSSKFLERYKGIAIYPESGDKIFALSILDPSSKIRVRYITPTDTSEIYFTFASTALAFNHITSDRTGSSLDGLSNYYQDFYPLDDFRYMQSGVGVVTKLDFSNYFIFTDTLPKIFNGNDSTPALVINSAELLLSNISKVGDYNPVSTLELIVLNDNNRVKPVILPESGQSDPILNSYEGWLTYEQNLFRAWAYTPVSDLQVPFQLAYNKEKNSYSGFLSPFFQALSKVKENKVYYTKYGLAHVSPAFNQSVNRGGVHKDNIKLRIYYTIPNLDNIN